MIYFLLLLVITFVLYLGYGIVVDLTDNDILEKETEEKVLLLHKLITEETGGDPNVRDIALLNSALESAFATFDGKELYPTKQEKGARLGFALISNHAFVDGNKRIGMYVLLTFLETNGIKLRPTNAEVARVGLAVAAGEMKYQELLEWILDNEV